MTPATLATWLRNTYLSLKSTLIGALGLAIVVILAWEKLPPKATAGVIALALLRAILHFISEDPGQALAFVPGSGVAKIVPAHEVPDDPTAVPLSKE